MTVGSTGVAMCPRPALQIARSRYLYRASSNESRTPNRLDSLLRSHSMAWDGWRMRKAGMMSSSGDVDTMSFGKSVKSMVGGWHLGVWAWA